METRNLQPHSHSTTINNHNHTYKDNSESHITCNNDTVLMVAKRYGKKLHSYFYNSMQSRFDADDLLQELYGRLLSYHRPIRTKSLSAFVYTIALNLIRDRSRRIDSHQIADTISIDDADEIPIETLDPRRIVGGIEELEQVGNALTEMQLECKKAFCLHRMQGLNHKQIALSMGVTVSMVEKHIMRVTKKLRKAANTQYC